MDNEDLKKILGFQYRDTSNLILTSLLYPIDQAEIRTYISQHPHYDIRNIFSNLKHTFGVTGLKGCYSGFLPCLATTFSYKYAFFGTMRLFSRVEEKEESDSRNDEEEEPGEYVRFRRFSRLLGEGIVCKTAGAVVSQPFYVITARAIAQLVCQEAKYTNLFATACRIIREEGVRGLFAGLWPRLLADLTLYVTVATSTYLVHRVMVSNSKSSEAIDLVIRSLGIYCCSRMHAVGCRMAVTNCGLSAGSPPHMPHYTNSLDCWKHLCSLSFPRELQK